MTGDDFVPPSLRRRLAEFSRELRYQPMVQRLTGTGRWRITVTSPRVTVTLDYKVLQRGRAVLAGSTLTVDGQPAALARDLDHLSVIFANPDAADLSDERAAAGTDPPDRTLTWSEDPSTAPEEIQRVFQALQSTIAGNGGVELKMGRDDHGSWCIAVESPRVILRVFHQTRTRPTGVTRRVVSDIQLIIDGEDLTEQVAGQLDRALGLMSPVFAQSPPPPAAPPPRQVPTGPSNAVRERRHSVIRQ